MAPTAVERHVNGVQTNGLLGPQTLIQILENAALSEDEARKETGLWLYKPETDGTLPLRWTYKELLSDAKSKAKILLHYLETQFPADTLAEKRKIVLLHFDNHVDGIAWFWAVVSAGLLPAISPPLSANVAQQEQHIQHLTTLLETPVVLSTDRLIKRYPELGSGSLTVTIEQLLSQASNVVIDEPHNTTNGKYEAQPPSGEEPAVLMLTSGSTGNAKAVELTVPQLIAAVRGKSKALRVSENARFLNWIGLDHVANLVEIHLLAMYNKADQVQMQAHDVISDPILFLKAIDTHRVTNTFAPNFFLALLTKRLAIAESEASTITDLDLSCLETVVSGGEANLVETAKVLCAQLEKLGVRRSVLYVAYGLTESSAGLTYGLFDPEYEDHEEHEFASIGKSTVAAKVRVFGDGKEAEPYEIGELQLSGNAIFKSYYRDPEATKKSFTSDGWFMTGDRGYIDRNGGLNIAGRSKEILIINGVNRAPQDIEAALETASLVGVVSSYFATFSHRPKGSDTEGYCVVYSPENTFEDPKRRDEIAESIARAASVVPGVRPEWLIPLPVSRLEKSSLGKLSRTRLKKQFDQGVFDDVRIRSRIPIQTYVHASYVAPSNKTETKVVEALSEMLEMPANLISVDRTIFELGVTSLTLFRFEHLLRKHISLDVGVSIITFLNSPVIRDIATAIDNANSHEYNPVAQLQARGSKLPLWLVHPASGNVLAFLPLARTIVDRPLYALTARGLGNNEKLFDSIPEMADTYFQHVKRTQPKGPYALTGYSLGTTVAFELAKRLEANGDEVAFCAALDSPPHIIPLVGPLDWTAAAIRVTYFLELIAQDDIPKYEVEFKGLSQVEVVNRLLEVSFPEQLAKLKLTTAQLMAIVHVTDNFGKMGKVYQPEGTVRKMDVFYCIPLKSVCLNKEKWVAEHLGAWQDFSREPIEVIECEGDHADMLNAEYVEGFEQRLSKVLAARGI
ncbi:putative NRPS-like enzyme [Talaromyces proteolyticus]|uniref:NRPS-like enzyme n=1 Tax=Talaromyces proteolyticus TaxID=1131652 RepID=A0AAD4L318_9EURO|nr:putative NRPS-like enzyme [Talaromyces proteolyticus]KAH8705690.1 putative NRPS-like enzyme [Talaromyces proteolyticus]